MSDYNETAKTWLAQLADELSGGATGATSEAHAERGATREIEGMATLIADKAPALAALLQAAYDDGVLARQAEKDAPVEAEVIRSNRQEDELFRKTMLILGSEARTLVGLRKTPHKMRAVALHARVDAKVLRDFLEGRKTKTTFASMIRRSLRQLGFPTEPGAPS